MGPHTLIFHFPYICGYFEFTWFAKIPWWFALTKIDHIFGGIKYLKQIYLWAPPTKMEKLIILSQNLMIISPFGGEKTKKTVAILHVTCHSSFSRDFIILGTQNAPNKSFKPNNIQNIHCHLFFRKYDCTPKICQTTPFTSKGLHLDVYLDVPGS